MTRKVVSAVVFTAIFVLGAVQLATDVVADPPIDCSLVLCFPCPEGTVPHPTPGNCCHCRPVH